MPFAGRVRMMGANEVEEEVMSILGKREVSALSRCVMVKRGVPSAGGV